MPYKNILVFNENESERKRLVELLRADDFSVFETSRVLEAVSILKREGVGLVLASQGMNKEETEEFRAIVQTSRPGVNILFLSTFPELDRHISINPDEFRLFLLDSLRTESALKRDIDGLKEFFISFADRLVQILEVNNRYFFNNDHMVAEMSRNIALKMGMDAEMADTIQMSALLKDIGKIGIQHQLLEDKRKLNQDELQPIKSHSLNSVLILKQIKFPWNVESTIAQHHEHYDGGGYPFGLKGREISLGARIIAIADSYYAMTTDRPYRKALSKDAAVQEIVKKAGSQFDPEIVEVFLSVLKEEAIEQLKRRTILILERQPTVSSIVKLSVDPDLLEIFHAANSFDAIRLAREKAPDVIVADVEILDREAFMHFYNVVREVPSVRNKPFLFILPDKNYPRQFKGKSVQYVLKPVNINELTMKINGLIGHESSVTTQAAEIHGVMGALEDFSFTDIIQTLNLGVKTAKVELQHGEEKGEVFLTHGRVSHAEVDSLKGNDAFFELVKWDFGSFRILHGLTPEKETITMDTIHLLLEAARVMDEQRLEEEINARSLRRSESA